VSGGKYGESIVGVPVQRLTREGQMREVDSAHQRTRHIRPTVARLRAFERLNRVDVFDSRADTGVLQPPDQLARPEIGAAGILVVYERAHREEPERRPSRRSRDHLVRVGDHLVGVAVAARTRDVHRGHDDLQKPVASARPLAAHLIAVTLGRDRIERNPAQREVHPATLVQQEPQKLRDGLRWIRVDCYRSNVKLADSRTEATEEGLIGQHFV
jgi:hypothetical protein